MNQVSLRKDVHISVNVNTASGSNPMDVDALLPLEEIHEPGLYHDRLQLPQRGALGGQPQFHGQHCVDRSEYGWMPGR